MLLFATFTTCAQTNSNNLLSNDTSAFEKTISKSLRYPPTARDSSITGVVIVTFKVDVKNHVQDIAIVRSPNTELSKAVTQVLENSAPAFSNNPDLVYALPVYFEIIDSLGYKKDARLDIKDKVRLTIPAKAIMLKKIYLRGYQKQS